MSKSNKTTEDSENKSGFDTQLVIMEQKRNAIFSYLQEIFDMSKNVSTRPSLREDFLDASSNIDTLRSEFNKIVEDYNSRLLLLNPSAKPEFGSLTSFERLYSRVKRLVSEYTGGVKIAKDDDPRRLKPYLPPIQLVSFDGCDLKAWSLFYTNFRTIIHENQTLTDAEKLYYLMGKLSGKAKLACAGITPSAENYQLIFKTLVDKFEDKRFLATSYLDQIYNIKAMSNATPTNLENFLDTFASSVAALKNLNLDNLADFLFLYLAQKKLDPETVRLFELNKHNSDIPLYDDFVAFLREHIKVLQRTSGKQDVPKGAERKADMASKPHKPPKSTHTYTTTATTPVQTFCSLCNSQHEHLYNCSAFHKMSVEDRFKFVKANNLCINCFGNHRLASCSSKSRCRWCASPHHSMIHRNSANVNSAFVNSASSGATSGATPSQKAPGATVHHPATTSTAGNDTSKSQSSDSPARSNDVSICSLSSSNISRSPTTVLLATARVIVFDAKGKEYSVRALLDSASQSNFVSRSLCERLGLQASKNPSCSVVKGIGGTTKPIQGSASIRFFSRFDLSVCFDIDSLVVDKVTERLPTVPVDIANLINFNNLPLADDTYFIPGDIDLLVGASIFPHLLLSRKVQGQSDLTSPLALETVLGYVIVGSAPVRADSCATVSYCCATDPLDTAVRKFWQMEEVNAPKALSPDDTACEEIYSNTTTREADGRYVVALPFKGDVLSLGDSLKKAKTRFFCLERKMLASPKLKEAYDSVILEYLDKGYISRASPDTEATQNLPSYTISHHGVIREDKLTSKLRVVLDASSKTTTQVSLNDILYNGQNLQGNLFNIIVNFRLYGIALSADIRQMFLCIGIRPCDRRFQRILYRFSPQEPLKVYEFNRVCFGLKSSPFHALRTVKQLLLDEGASYPRAKETVDAGLYMDDFVYSVDSEHDAISTAAEVIALLKAGQFDLVKWMSNSQKVLDAIPLSHRLSAVKEFDDSEPHKVLGLCWSPATDYFSLKISVPAESCTKRTILSCVAKIWDVMGFVAPVVLYAKLLIKQLWLCECDWDDVPPEHIIEQWSRFKKELPLLSELKIPRHVGIVTGDIVTIVGFADASEKAYGGVVYFHVKDGRGLRRNSVFLITAKSKVSPRKVVSLARLELCAILTLSSLITRVVEACNNRINIDRILAFSDSTVALCWVHSSPHRWDTFVANRVTKIQNEFPVQTFFHVQGTDNPADCLSRGLTPAQIIDHPLWFSGPEWLETDPNLWPVTAFNPSTVSQPPEEKKHVLLAAEGSEGNLIISLADRFSSWSKFLRCVVYVCRFAKLLPRRETVTASDLDYAENLILREIQHSYFADEIANLQSGKYCSPMFQRLKPFLQDKIIRVGGRLRNADISFDTKHPIILPRKGHILDLLVDYHHKVNCHAGPDLLMSILRQRYWILSARNLIRSRVHKCLPCFRLRAKPNFPEMADHRSCRVTPAVKPFLHTGTDYAGPFKVTISRGRGIRPAKAYVCLFVCLTTRAVHIEVASDLSTASFLGAFKRFQARRGLVARVHSDNATNYVCAKRTLSELHDFLMSKHFRSEFGHILAENRIEWSLNVPTACHFGGNWEANIKSLKAHLYRVIGDQILTLEEFSTVLAQIEAVMNSRPLCRTLSNDPSESLALTPAHFLTLTPLKYLPAQEIEEGPLHLLSRQELIDKLVQSFWKRWKADYLHTLQTRNKWNTPTNPIAKGDVVIIIVDNAPPLHWPLGVVEEVFPGSNGVTRIVRVRTATGTYLRPVVRLCPLPKQ
ncbi:uncharacterized protein LOC123663262 [Melitaea cinxia]|uniref:uncharacterized protein LOC123663262 n=1 Tax=Melitaea cinxia TaxID=113334 RepID=UPI001E273E1F|nr:uncharacterized protein LOC123663262 [Melitaea cinxia]